MKSLSFLASKWGLLSDAWGVANSSVAFLFPSVFIIREPTTWFCDNVKVLGKFSFTALSAQITLIWNCKKEYSKCIESQRRGAW